MEEFRFEFIVENDTTTHDIWLSLYRQGGWGPKLNPGFTQNVDTGVESIWRASERRVRVRSMACGNIYISEFVRLSRKWFEHTGQIDPPMRWDSGDVKSIKSSSSWPARQGMG